VVTYDAYGDLDKGDIDLISKAESLRADITTRLKTMIIEHSLPLWSTEGWDHVSGGFVERLDKNGNADRATPRRVRVQARQIYCYAKAADLGWYPKGREIALSGLEYLLTRAKSPDGRPGFVHLLTSDGAVINPLRDSYDHAFVLLALATVYELTGDAQVRAEIDEALAFLDRELRSPSGGFLEGLPPTLPRRQNPHMHLFEAMIALFDATGDSGFRARAGDIYSLFMSNFYDARNHVLAEYYEEDWSRIKPVCVEPGHQAEWVWLLKGFERISGCPTDQYRAALLASALRYRDSATGCLIDEGDLTGVVTKSSRRCWPQTEIAKAWIAQAEGGKVGASDEARNALVRLLQHYLSHPVAGGWYDQFDANGNSLVDFIPASSFYHVICAVAEAERVLG